jgi:hypothetical protein
VLDFFSRWLFRREKRSPRILVIDDFVPERLIGAGVPRAAELLRGLAATGAEVTLWAVSDFLLAEHARVTLDGVFIRHRRQGGLGRFLAGQRGALDGIIVSRPHNMRMFRGLLEERPNLAGTATIVYDAEAIFAERETIKAEVLGAPLAPEEAQRLLDEELALAASADIVLVVNERNAARFAAAGHDDARVLRYALTPRPSMESFERRDGFLFVGPTRTDHEPNSDAVIWFVDHVLPSLRRALGRDVSLRLAGMSGASLIASRSRAGLEMLGAVPDLTKVYSRARVFVAPTRFSAGIPLKVYDAAAHGVPAVVTPLLATQLGWTDGLEALVAQTPKEFASACARLHEDGVLWEGIRMNAMARVAEDCSVEVFDGALARLVSDIGVRKS